MTRIRFLPLPTDKVDALRRGGTDAHGLPPERTLSDGSDNPCRHCLDFIPEGAGMLVLAWRPFTRIHPYAETGPIFLCAQDCPAWHGAGRPPILSSPDYLLKGYTADERIRYGSGKIVANAGIEAYAAELLADDEIAFVDVRSARNNCFQLRIARAD
ncbi:DUF1203 domain-containing protein [Pseudogemmobacter sonorensis]|uniref:DUF1203 domain-containing protein n=1 Tax=Pseudogemmobacter sonorensis TaxID=2989681 RepID=UPI003673F16E